MLSLLVSTEIVDISCYDVLCDGLFSVYDTQLFTPVWTIQFQLKGAVIFIIIVGVYAHLIV